MKPGNVHLLETILLRYLHASNRSAASEFAPDPAACCILRARTTRQELRVLAAIGQVQTGGIRDCLTNHFSSCQSVGRRDLPLLRVLVGVLKEGEGSGHLVLRVIISGVLLGCCAINQSAPAGWQRALRPERRRWLGRD